MMTRILTKRIFLRRVALITSRSRSSCAHPSALPRGGRKSCMSARHVTIPTRSTRWFLRRFVQASHYASTSSHPKRRFEKSTTSRLLLESPEASHQPKKFQIPESSRKRLIEVTDAPTEKTRPTEVLATRTGKDYARIYPRASQPESQEEAAPDQTKKAVPQSEYVTSLVISASYQLRSLFWS